MQLVLFHDYWLDVDGLAPDRPHDDRLVRAAELLLVHRPQSAD